MKDKRACVKTSNSFVVLLIFWIWLSQFVCLVGRICGVRAYFQPMSVASAKIRLIRISAENTVQPANFVLKNPAEGSSKHRQISYLTHIFSLTECSLPDVIAWFCYRNLLSVVSLSFILNRFVVYLLLMQVVFLISHTYCLFTHMRFSVAADLRLRAAKTRYVVTCLCSSLLECR